jgi:hypothetical protein
MQALSFGEKCEQALNGGRLTLSDIAKPLSMVSFFSFKLQHHLTINLEKTDKWAANAVYI